MISVEPHVNYRVHILIRVKVLLKMKQCWIAILSGLDFKGAPYGQIYGIAL